VSIAIYDQTLHQAIEPGTPSPRARLELVRAIRSAGFDCGVMLAPVLPLLTDSTEQLDAALATIAAAGAAGATVLPLHLRPGAREWFMAWLATDRPDLVPAYQRLYAGGSYVARAYRDRLAETVRPLLERHGLDGHAQPRGPQVVPAEPQRETSTQLALL
jgi:DNA repair photolyase